MTPAELRKFAEEATPGPWMIEGTGVVAVGIRSSATSVATAVLHKDAPLIILAPDLARLCAEYAGAFAQIEKLHHKDFDLAPQIARRALAKFSELKS